MEVEADEVGLILAAKACFDIREAPKFWARMAQEEEPFGEVTVFMTIHMVKVCMTKRRTYKLG